MEKLRMTGIMMATVRYFTSGAGHTKSQAAWFLFHRVYKYRTGTSFSIGEARAHLGWGGGAVAGLQPPPNSQNQNLKNTDFVDIMVSDV
jgi:hypothetical protein